MQDSQLISLQLFWLPPHGCKIAITAQRITLSEDPSKSGKKILSLFASSVLLQRGNLSQKHRILPLEEFLLLFLKTKLGHMFNWKPITGKRAMGLPCLVSIGAALICCYCPEQSQSSVSKVAEEHGCWIGNNQQCHGDAETGIWQQISASCKLTQR